MKSFKFAHRLIQSNDDNNTYYYFNTITFSGLLTRHVMKIMINVIEIKCASLLQIILVEDLKTKLVSMEGRGVGAGAGGGGGGCSQARMTASVLKQDRNTLKNKVIKVKKNVVYYYETQRANFRGKFPFQVTKQHLNNS